ncbi:MAG: DUF11 domain-containing protein [Methanobacterium sp.]
MIKNRKKISLILISLVFFSVLGTVFSANNPNVSITTSFNPSEAKIGDNVTLVVTITNNGPYDFSNVLVMAKLPQGLTYLSHYTGLDRNIYDPNTGIWDVGNMNFGKKGAQKTLNITAKVSSQVSDPANVQFTQISYNNNGQQINADVLPSSSATLKVSNSNQPSSGQQNNNTGLFYIIIAIIIIAIFALAYYFIKMRG